MYPCLQISQTGVSNTSSKSFISRTMGSTLEPGVGSELQAQQHVLSSNAVGRSGEAGASSQRSLLTVLYSVVMSLPVPDDPSLLRRKLKQSLFSLLHSEMESLERAERGVMRGVARAVLTRAMSRAHSTNALARAVLLHEPLYHTFSCMVKVEYVSYTNLHLRKFFGII